MIVAAGRPRGQTQTLLFLLILVSLCSLAQSARYRGEWNSAEERIKLIAKFGFQQISSLDRKGSRGFVYGNVTAGEFTNSSRPVLLAIVPQAQYSSFELQPSNEYLPACSMLMQNLSAVAFESTCFKEGQRGDYFRWVPCKENELCEDEDDPSVVLPGSQLTLQVEEPKTAEYWYVLLIACDLSETCTWEQSDTAMTIHYDLWLTNGNPRGDYAGIFTLQFSFDEQDTAQIYLVTFFVYAFFTVGAIRANILYKRNLPSRMRLLAVVIVVKCAGSALQSLNALIYSANGEGVWVFRFFGEILGLASTDILCLLLILIARGWGVASRSQALSNMVLISWFVISIADTVLFLCNMFFVFDLPHEVDIFHSWPGHCMMFIRSVLALWFLLEIRALIASEKNDEKAAFFAHFGAGFLVWFVYLFGLGVIASFVSDLWRFRIILGIRTLANGSATGILLHLFWPTSTNRKFFDGVSYRLSGRLRVDSSELQDMERLLFDNSDDDEDSPVHDGLRTL